MSVRKKVAIIGGGISGLTLAHKLQSNPKLDVHVYEKSKRWGGTLHSESKEGFLLEHGPDCFLNKNPETLNLIDELKLTDELTETRAEFRRSYILKNGSLIEVPKGFYLMAPKEWRSFLSSPLLSWKGKLRAGLDYLLPKGKAREDESLASFVTRRFGRELLDQIAAPMVGGIYTADPNKLSLKATLPRFIELEQKYGSVIRGLQKESKLNVSENTSGPRYNMFLSFKRGMSRLAEELEKSISTDSLHLEHDLVQANRNGDSWELEFENPQSPSPKKIQADILCLASSSNMASKVLASSMPGLSKKLQRIPFASSAIVNMAFEDNSFTPPGMGFVIPARENKKILACSFLHHKFSGRAPEGSSLLRIFLGGRMQEEILNAPNETLFELAEEELRSILPKTPKPKFAKIQRWNHSMPQYELGHQERVHEIKKETPPNLYLLGNAYEGVGIPDLIKSSIETAKAIQD